MLGEEDADLAYEITAWRGIDAAIDAAAIGLDQVADVILGWIGVELIELAESNGINWSCLRGEFDAVLCP